MKLISVEGCFDSLIILGISEVFVGLKALSQQMVMTVPFNLAHSHVFHDL